jgi:hypothetical protein
MLRRFVLVLVLAVAVPVSASDGAVRGSTATTRPGRGTDDLVNVRNFGAKGDATTDDTAAFKAAIDAAGKWSYTNPYRNIVTVGGGIVFVPVGRYRITDTLLVPGGLTIRGVGPGTVLSFRPAAPKSLIAPDPAKKTVGNSWVGITIEDLQLFGESAGARDGIYLYDASNVSVKRTTIAGFARYGLYLGHSAGGPYYNTTERNVIYDCGVDLYLDTQANVFTDVGSYLFHLDDFTGADYTVVVKSAKATFVGTSIEGRPHIAQVEDEGVGTTFVGTYSETRGHGTVSDKPFIRRPTPTSPFDATNLLGVLRKKVLFGRWAESAQESSSYEPQYPMVLTVGSPHFLADLIQNPGKYGTYGWSIAGGTGTLSWDPSRSFGNGRGSLRLTTSGNGDVYSVQYTIPGTSLAKYVGRRLYVTLSIYTTGAAQLEPHVLGAGNAHAKFIYNDGIDFGNGWLTKEMDIPILSASDLAVVLRIRGTDVSANFCDVFAYLDGWDPIPFDRETRVVATAAPTTGTWAVGDAIWNSAPAVGEPLGWVCTEAGAPGSWKAMGRLAP